MFHKKLFPKNGTKYNFLGFNIYVKRILNNVCYKKL